MITIHTEALNQGLSVHTRSLSLNSETKLRNSIRKLLTKSEEKVCTGAMGALAPAILKNRLLVPTILGHFNTVGKNCGC